MKYMFVSDVHGNVTCFDEILRIRENENADYLVFLGDTASRMWKEDNQYIAERINQLGNKVEVILGNCDTWDFEEKLHQELLEWDNIFIGKKVVTITHGHRFNRYDLPPNCGEIFVQGHTHVPVLEEYQGRIFANPGSVSKPRGGDLRCYLLVTEKEIVLKTLNGKEIKKVVFT